MPVVADALDPDQVAEAVGSARPDVIVHQLTAIGAVDMRHFDRDFALTNRLRTEGTDHLLSAGQAVGVRRFVAQGVAAYGAYARTGGPVKTEEDPLDSAPAREMRETLAAIRHLEEAVLGCAVDGGDRAALRRVLRAGHVAGAGRGAVRADPQAQVPAGRRRRRRVVVHPRRRRGGGDGGGGRARRAAASTTSSTTTPPRSPSGCRRWRRRWAPRSRCACRGSSGGCSPGRPAW